MRLQRYLNEKYLGATARTEIFVNPSRKELKELQEMSGENGIRFVMDNKTQKFIVWNGYVIHQDVFEKSSEVRNELKSFNYTNYYRNGEHADHVFTGAVDEYGNIHSDTWFGDFYGRFGNDNIYNNMKKFQQSDLSWARKYVDVKKLKYIIKRAIEEIEAKRNK